METFRWNKSFVTGLDSVDGQHHHLVDIINRYGDLATRDALEAETAEEVFEELSAYAVYHFEEEEALMRTVGVDSRHYEEHKIEHQHFLEDVAARHKTLDFKEKDSTESLLRFLSYWLVVHILGSDQNMARQISAIRAGTNPADAYDREERDQSVSTSILLIALHGLFKQVSDRNRDLLELNQTLEQKVQMRTRALADANTLLEHMALTDVLTNLPNRRQALQRLQILWDESSANGKPVSCMMVDADGFKQINDNHGHDAGDIVLRELARTLEGSVRTDDIASRLGGDEFFLICPDTPYEGAMLLAENIRKIVDAMRVKAFGGIWEGSISIGVATRDEKMASFEDLVKAADEGVYLAKEAGKNCVRSIH